jgi:hypothetical protein
MTGAGETQAVLLPFPAVDLQRPGVLVLQGGYRDEPSGERFLPGDLQEMAAGTSNSYVVLPERPLLAAVSLVGGVDVAGIGSLTTSG